MYNTVMKIFFISSTAFIIYLMRYKKPYCTVSALLTPDLRLSRRRLPPLYGADSRRPGAHMHRSVGLDSLGTHLELQSLAGGAGLSALDCDAEQDKNRRKHHLALRGRAWPV